MIHTPPLDAHRGHRRLWSAVGICLAGFASLFGGTYAVTGNSQVYSPSLYVMKTDLPGGMRTAGFIFLFIGALMASVSMHPDVFARKWPVLLYCGTWVAVSLSVIGSWFLDGHVVIGAFWVFLAFAAISGAMIVWPPPPKHIRRGDISA